MVRKYYEVLEVGETATQEQIKKAYKRLSLKWHPDKNLGSKEAEEKFKKINEAYGVLGNETSKRIYDNWESNSYSGSRNYDFWEEFERKSREWREEAEAKAKEREWRINAELLDRKKTISEIENEAKKGRSIYIYAECPSKLWEPYGTWESKVWEMPITIVKGKKERSDELKQLKEEMVAAIRKRRKE